MMSAHSAVLICFCFLSCEVSAPDVEDCQTIIVTCDKSGNVTVTVPKNWTRENGNVLRILHKNRTIFSYVEPGEDVTLLCDISEYYLANLNYLNGKLSDLLCYKIHKSTRSPLVTDPGNKAAKRHHMVLIGLVSLFVLVMVIVWCISRKNNKGNG